MTTAELLQSYSVYQRQEQKLCQTQVSKADSVFVVDYPQQNAYNKNTSNNLRKEKLPNPSIQLSI